MGKKFNRRRLDSEETGPPPIEPWVVSFGDMMSLLFCLFVAMYAMSQMDKDKFKAVSQALADAFQNKKTVVEQRTDSEEKTDKKNLTPPPLKMGDPIPRVEEKDNPDLVDISKKINTALSQRKKDTMVSLKMEERGLVITMLTDKYLFPVGDAELTKQSQELLHIIAPILNEYNYPIRIEGHTCNLPIFTSRFRSNWELSTMRATNVAYFLITSEKVVPERVSIIGYGEYKPLHPNTVEKNRARNRRVDIVVLDTNKRTTFGSANSRLSPEQKKLAEASSTMVKPYVEIVNSKLEVIQNIQTIKVFSPTPPATSSTPASTPTENPTASPSAEKPHTPSDPKPASSQSPPPTAKNK